MPMCRVELCGMDVMSGVERNMKPQFADSQSMMGLILGVPCDGVLTLRSLCWSGRVLSCCPRRMCMLCYYWLLPSGRFMARAVVDGDEHRKPSHAIERRHGQYKLKESGPGMRHQRKLCSPFFKLRTRLEDGICKRIPSFAWASVTSASICLFYIDLGALSAENCHKSSRRCNVQAQL